MKLEEKLQLLRKRNGYSQEQLSDKIGIARQTISKWENGQAIPELNGLILLSELYLQKDMTYWSTLANSIETYCDENKINYIN